MEGIAWVRGARLLLEDSLRVRAGENVLIVGDNQTAKLVEVAAFLAVERGARVSICTFEAAGRHSVEPPAPVAAAMKAADAILALTAYSITHTEARRAANAAGARIAMVPGANEAVFTGGSLDVDLHEIARTLVRVGRLFKAARRARITSDNGTDVRLELDGRDSVDQTGLCHEPGSWAALPDLETAVSPLEGSVEGTWVVDGTVPQAGLMPVAQPIVVTISRGVVTEIQGAGDAAALRAFLESYNDPNAYAVVEMGLAANPRARMERAYPESEAEHGTMHLGLGDGSAFGSSIRAAVHCDLVLRHPVLELDGRTILRDRKLLIEQ